MKQIFILSTVKYCFTIHRRHVFLVGSTAQTTQTKEYEGQTYPYMTIDVSSASHPFTLGSRNQRKAMVAWPDSTSATTAAPAAEISSQGPYRSAGISTYLPRPTRAGVPVML